MALVDHQSEDLASGLRLQDPLLSPVYPSDHDVRRELGDEDMVIGS
jgi:hypothetical protein